MSIFDDLHEVVDEWLETGDIGTVSPHYKNRSACLAVSSHAAIAPAPIGPLFKAVLNKWKENTKPDIVRRTLGSAQNWRFKPCPEIAPHNKSEEKRLEKRLVKKGPCDWANQVPVASGAASPYSNRKTSIDLVRCVEEGREYVLYELKIKSDNPLYAAMEILRNGIAYLVARKRVNDQDSDSMHLILKDKDLLKATCIHLAVLAPEDFYRRDNRYNLDLLTRAINEGLASFLAGQDLGLLKIDFAFEVLPDGFEKQEACRLRSMIADRHIFKWAS